MLAVTDHNRLDWYPVLAEAGSAVGVTVFPGLEFNVNKCHLLAIWDRNEKGYELGRQFLASLFDPGVEPLTTSREHESQPLVHRLRLPGVPQRCGVDLRRL